MDKVTELYTAEEISRRVKAMASDIAVTVTDKELVVVALLNGSFIFAADLIRDLSIHNLNPQVDFITLASYGSSTKSSGKIQALKGLSIDVKNKYVLLVDDILESGRTLEFARKMVFEAGAADVSIAVLLEKPGKNTKPELKADFIGFKVPDLFVVGYGLDYANRHRELPYIGVLEHTE